MLFLAFVLLVTVPPILGAATLAVQAVFLWRRRAGVRADIRFVADYARAPEEMRIAMRSATKRDLRSWRLGDQGDLKGLDLKTLWWLAFHSVTIDDYMSDAEVRGTIDSLAREIAKQRTDVRKVG